MFIRDVLIFVVLLLSFQANGQARIDSICWDQNIKLKWSDFQGEKPLLAEIEWMAGCAAELQAKGFWDGGLPDFRITNCFDKRTSWTDDTTSSHGLEHEQLHFDIAEIHARRMRKAVDSLRELGVRSIGSYSEVIQYLLDRRNRVDNLYDKETAHSIYAAHQERWKKMIWDELENLSEYEAPLSVE